MRARADHASRLPSSLKEFLGARNGAPEVDDRQGAPVGQSLVSGRSGETRDERGGPVEERHLEQDLLLELDSCSNVRPDLEVVRRQRFKIGVVRIEHCVPAQEDQLDEVLFPAARPPVRPDFGHDRLRDGERELRQAQGEVGVELAPLLGEVRGSPRARDLREVRRRGVQREVAEEAVGVKRLSTFRAQLDVLLLVQGDAEQAWGRSSTGEGVTIVEDGELEPAIEEGRDLDVIFEKDAVRVVRGGIPRLDDGGHQAAEKDPVPNRETAMRPVEIVG